MTTREIAAAMMKLGAESMRDHMLGDPVLTPRLGFEMKRVRGLWCFSSRALEEEVFNHVSGYGTYARATEGAIDGVLRHYERVGQPARIEVLLPAVTRGDRALLARNGFRDAKTLFQTHIRTTSRPPRRHDIEHFEAVRVTARDAGRYARLATAGFGGHGVTSDVFERGWIRQLRNDKRVNAFMGMLRGRPVASGVMILRPRIAGFYSGSVLPRHRGHGLQNAMIAARLAYGWSRGARTFYSWTDPDSASARNLRDEGFRTRFEVHLYVRET